jgi:hypothetical protein
MQSPLLAVQAVAAMGTFMLIYALALAQATPTPLNDAHKRDIACVVEVAIVADKQKQGRTGGADVQQSGRRWAGVVGTRIMAETGQPRELVAFAMQEAATARATIADNDKLAMDCVLLMQAELALIDMGNKPLPKPEKTK